MKSLFQIDICTLIFTAALFTLLTIAKTWKQPKCPWMDELIKKMWCIHIFNVIFISRKKKEILPFVTI